MSGSEPWKPSREAATMSRLEVGAQATSDLVSMGLSPREASETVGTVLSRDRSRRDIERRLCNHVVDRSSNQ